MLDLLERQVTEEGIRNELESLPETLVGLYQNTLQTMEKNASKDLREMAQRVLRWVLAAQRPLTIDGLMMALRAENLKTKENPTISDLGPFIPNYRERLWQICFPLLEVLEDNTVQVIHVSLRQYLLGQNISGHEPVTAAGGDHSYFRYNPPKEHLELALTCVAYLSVQTMKSVGLSEIESDGNVKKPEVGLIDLLRRIQLHELTNEEVGVFCIRNSRMDQALPAIVRGLFLPGAECETLEVFSGAGSTQKLD